MFIQIKKNSIVPYKNKLYKLKPMIARKRRNCYKCDFMSHKGLHSCNGILDRSCGFGYEYYFSEVKNKNKYSILLKIKIYYYHVVIFLKKVLSFCVNKNYIRRQK